MVTLTQLGVVIPGKRESSAATEIEPQGAVAPAVQEGRTVRVVRVVGDGHQERGEQRA